jgi:TetR/AcrR family transcriptional repressor of mexJK operon
LPNITKRRRPAAKVTRSDAPARKSVRSASKRVSGKPGPGRPTAARIEAINRAILKEARKEFKNSGYEAVRMDVIAAAAGVSKSTLYDRYPTKEALLRAVIAERVATWSEEWEPDDGSTATDLRERLKQRASRLMEYYCSGKLEFLERLFTSSPAMDELRRTRYEVGHQRTVQVIAQDIVDRTSPTIQPRTAMRLAEMLMGILYGWWRTHQQIRRVTREEGLTFASHAVDILFDGRSAWAGIEGA